MKKRLLLAALALALLGTTAAVGAHFSLITVTNRSGQVASHVSVISEAFGELPCDTLAPGESRRFLRWPRNGCGIAMKGTAGVRPFFVGGGFCVSGARGYLLDVVLQPQLTATVNISPTPSDSYVVTPMLEGAPPSQ